MNNCLKQIFAAFRMMNRVYNAPEDGSSPSGDVAEVEDEIVDDIVDDDSPYVGSKELNPDQYPLNFTTDDLDNDTIDEMISASENPFMSKEEYQEYLANKKSESDAKDKPEENDEEGSDEDKDPDKELTDEEKEAKADLKFIEDAVKASGKTVDEFKALPEDEREKIINDYVPEETESEKPDEIEVYKSELEKAKADYEALLSDPVIAARVHDKTSGTKFAVDTESILTDEIINKVDAALADENDPIGKAKTLLKDFVKKAVENERLVHDTKKAQDEKDANKNDFFLSAGKIDKRLSTKHTDLRKISFEDLQKENKDLADFIAYSNQKLNLETMSQEEAYASFAHSKGWDKQAINNAVIETRKRALKKIRNPEEIAKTLSYGNKARGPRPNLQNVTSAGFDREGLIKEMVEGGGNSPTFGKLQSRHQNDPNAVAMLGEILDEVNRRVFEGQRSKKRIN